jgi:hypothetical protein
MDTRLPPVRLEMIEEADANFLSLIKDTRGAAKAAERATIRNGRPFSRSSRLTRAQVVSTPDP